MYPIIDCHCHIYPDKIAQKATEGIGKFYNLAMEYDGRLDTLFKESDKVGIKHSLIFSVATKPEQADSINRYIAGEVKEFPNKFTGLGAIHPDSKCIDEEIDYLLSLGLKGVKLHPDIQQIAINDKRCYKIYERLEGVAPVLLHTGDKRYNYSNPENLIPVLKDFPNLKVIGAHFGGYSIWGKVESLKGFDNLYVDCSSALAFLTPDKAKELVEFYGANRVLFATDFPMWNFKEEIERFEKIGLKEEEKEQIYYKNACELFGIDQNILV